MLGRQPFVDDVDDSIGADDVTSQDLCLIVYIHGILKTKENCERHEHREATQNPFPQEGRFSDVLEGPCDLSTLFIMVLEGKWR